MKKYEKIRNELINEINEKFRDVSRENGVSYQAALRIDDYEDIDIVTFKYTDENDKSWNEVPDEYIRDGYSVLSFLDEIGYRYYIPAYMTWYLRNMFIDNEGDPVIRSNTFEYLIYSLGGVDADSSWLKNNKFSIFNRDQSRSIAKFIMFSAWFDYKNSLEKHVNGLKIDDILND